MQHSGVQYLQSKTFPVPGEKALHQQQAIPHYYNNNNNNNNDRLTAFDPGQPG